MAYISFTETFILTITDFYTLKVHVQIDFLQLQLFKQTLAFVHPWAILAAKNKDSSVDLPFDLKLQSEFKIEKLLDVTIDAADNMRANFNKQLDYLAQKYINSIASSLIDYIDWDYVKPEEDPKSY